MSLSRFINNTVDRCWSVSFITRRRRRIQSPYSLYSSRYSTMAPVATDAASQNGSAAPAAASAAPTAKAAVIQSNILYRMPYKPPVTLSAHGMYFECEGGRTIMDAVGGAAVTCIGNGHPKVVQAIKDQAEKLSCKFIAYILVIGADELIWDG